MSSGEAATGVVAAIIFVLVCFISCEQEDQEEARCRHVRCPEGQHGQVIGTGYKGFTPVCMCVP